MPLSLPAPAAQNPQAILQPKLAALLQDPAMLAAIQRILAGKVGLPGLPPPAMPPGEGSPSAIQANLPGAMGGAAGPGPAGAAPNAPPHPPMMGGRGGAMPHLGGMPRGAAPMGAPSSMHRAAMMRVRGKIPLKR